MSAVYAANDLFRGATSIPPGMTVLETSDRPTVAWITDSRVGDRAVGISAAWRSVLKRASRVAPTEATTCLQGESGTGKEVVASLIHSLSPRRRGPFVAINCAALPEQLLESELFGFERGAFTGAQTSKPGQVELAAGGTLFLDEITEMTPTAQAKFLRLLQEREFLRLGGTRPIRANVRVIAATNQDLREAVGKGKFRADLYYRVNVFDIQLPPLRERKEDIPVLAATFLMEFSRQTANRPPELTLGAMDALLHHEWPGNVRELRNVMERAALLANGGIIQARDLPLNDARATNGASHNGDEVSLAELERRHIETILSRTNWHQGRAASVLGISSKTLYRKIREYGFHRPRAANGG